MATTNLPLPATLSARLGLWFGLTAGLVEGAAFLLLQRFGWLNWRQQSFPVSAEIVWAALLTDGLLFLVAGLFLGAISRWLPARGARRLPVLGLAFLLFYDWAIISGYLYHVAALALAAGFATVFTRWAVSHADAFFALVRRTLPALVALALIAGAGVEVSKWLSERNATVRLPSTTERPNVVVIVVDTLRADHVSVYGYRRKTTPRLDQLAQRGVLFENAFSASSWTMPSHASLVTGRHVFEHQAETRPLD